MEELLRKVSEATGVPVDMLERAARARAGAAGKTPEAVAAEWAGEPVPEAGAEPAPVAAETVAPPEAEAAPPEPEEPGLGVEVLEPEAAEAAAAEAEPEPEPVPAGPGLPGWLTAAFVIVPFLAVVYALTVPNGPDCGSAGKLAIDPVTGVAVNCDGSEFGVGEVDFFAAGRLVYDGNCAVCHGAAGGGGAGPALAGGAVLTTFSSCVDHIEWVTLGSAGWPEDAYGDTNKTVSGGMPAFGDVLSEQDLAAAVLYERVQFGGQDLPAAETGCGVGPAAGEETAAPAQ